MTNYIRFQNSSIAIIEIDDMRWLNGDHVLRLIYGRAEDKQRKWAREMLPPHAVQYRDIETETGQRREFLMSYWAALILAIKSDATNARGFRDFFVNIIEAEFRNEGAPDGGTQGAIRALERRLEEFMAQQAAARQETFPRYLGRVFGGHRAT